MTFIAFEEFSVFYTSDFHSILFISIQIKSVLLCVWLVGVKHVLAQCCDKLVHESFTDTPSWRKTTLVPMETGDAPNKPLCNLPLYGRFWVQEGFSQLKSIQLSTKVCILLGQRCANWWSEIWLLSVLGFTNTSCHENREWIGKLLVQLPLSF